MTTKKPPQLEKKVALVACAKGDRFELIDRTLKVAFSDLVVFAAHTGAEMGFKIENVIPAVCLIDSALENPPGLDMVEKILRDPDLKKVSVVYISPLPEHDLFVDQIVTGQVQILVEPFDDKKLIECVLRAIRRFQSTKEHVYRVRNLLKGDILLEEGETSKSVYILKSGKLVAKKVVDGKSIILGEILAGEFVGEMAHIINEPRTATVTAAENSELIEIPEGTLDTILFSKPAWTKALMETLSKRIKRTNEAIGKK